MVEIAQFTGTDQAADLLSGRQTAKAHVGAAQGGAVPGGRPRQVLGLFDAEGERLLTRNGASGRHRGRDQLVSCDGARADQHHSSHAATLHFLISRKFLSR
ncbi:hypothetical protein [Streptomyces iranensis]|uniref:hypothetical protein n=1 Tax=Streptomyces iranensis TaxID=576784 RepID=UPI0039B76410